MRRPQARRQDAKIIREAIAVVDPEHERMDECRAWIRDATVTVRSVQRDLPSPAALRDRLVAHAHSLRKNRHESEALGMPTHFAAALDKQIEFAEGVVRRIKMPTGGELPNMTGQVAASLARETLKHFGRPVTKTVDSPYFRLASLLSEAATGIEGADLSRQCRKAKEILVNALVGRPAR